MARKTKSRLDKRRELEAAESMEKAAPKKKAAKKKATRKTTTRRTKTKANARKRLMWGLYNGNMKEEARFAYHEREAAEEKMEQLQTKSPKKMFFIQPVKVEIEEKAEEADE